MGYAVTHEELDRLAKKLDNKADGIASRIIGVASVSLLLPFNIAGLYIDIFRIIIWFKRSLAMMDKVAKQGCVECERKGACDYPFADSIDKAAHRFRLVIKRQKKIHIFPKAFIHMQEQILSDVDSRVEDFYIASDPEIKNLMHKVASNLHAKVH